MDKRRQIAATTGEVQLPDEIIHHILSFLSGIEAVRTTILSKSCYNAWLTRPNLDYLETDIPKRHRLVFLNSLNKTMQTSLESNQKIRSLRLLMYYESWIHGASDKFSLANELIVKAMKLGVTDIDIQIRGYVDPAFVLPIEVLESETLVRLSLIGARIDLQNTNVSCSGLKSLTLSGVGIEGDTNLWDICFICPLIEKLVLHDSHHNFGLWELKPAGLCVDNFRKLRVLSLEEVKIGEWFFGHISKCPCLKELTLHECSGFTEIQIYSNSLEFISFFSIRLSILRFKFDVPRIRKFKFLGICVPSLSFKTPPMEREWESDIFIRYRLEFDVLKISWFHELNPSKISLSLDIVISPLSPFPCDQVVEMIPRVEKLTLLMYAPSSVHSTVVQKLFWSCRPKFITLYWLPCSDLLPFMYKRSVLSSDFTKLICNTVERIVSDYAQFVEEINVEVFEDDVVAGRQLLPWKTLMEASTNSEKIVIVRSFCKFTKDYDSN